MKVKLFTEFDEPKNSSNYCTVSLDKRINEFIKNKKVIDIKYQANAWETVFFERALVMYEDQQDLSNDPDVQWFRDTTRKLKAGIIEDDRR